MKKLLVVLMLACGTAMGETWIEAPRCWYISKETGKPVFNDIRGCEEINAWISTDFRIQALESRVKALENEKNALYIPMTAVMQMVCICDILLFFLRPICSNQVRFQFQYNF